MFGSMEGADRRKEEDRIRNEGRLPPGQALTFKFPVLHYGPVPHFNPASWDFRVWGEVEQEKTWTWDEFNKLPRTKIQMDIHCVTRWSKFDTVWEGVSVKTMVENGLFTIKPKATHVMQHAEYGFTVNLLTLQSHLAKDPDDSRRAERSADEAHISGTSASRLRLSTNTKASTRRDGIIRK